MLFEDTFKANHPRPNIKQVHQALVAYYGEHGKGLGLQPPPPESTIECHIHKNHHSRGWYLWDTDGE